MSQTEEGGATEVEGTGLLRTPREAQCEIRKRGWGLSCQSELATCQKCPAHRSPLESLDLNWERSYSLPEQLFLW